MAQLTMAVIYGSRSCEHDVSVVSALQFMDAAEKGGYKVVPVYIARDGKWYTGDALREVAVYRRFDPATHNLRQTQFDISAGSRNLIPWPPAKRKGLFGGEENPVIAHIDVAAPLLHGLHGEDGTVQGLLELAGIPYTSSGVMGSAVGMDKIAMKLLFIGAGLPVLPYTWFLRDAWERDPEAVMAQVEKALAYPVFVKPANLGSSIGIGRAVDHESLGKAIEVAISFDRRVLVEAGVVNPKEVNCSVLGYGEEVRPSVCEMPVSTEEFLTYQDKYLRAVKTDGSKGMQSLARQVPAPIGEEMTERAQKLACDAFRTLDCKGVVRVDMLLDEDGNLCINEINTIPGSLAFYLWVEEGMGYPQLIEGLVEYAFRAHAQKTRSVFAYDSTILQSYQQGTRAAKGVKP
ncbi:MAG: D-alanine--D-alanine ligase [Clostridia bacterium]|nr:D-alanine--D-alanine ligase [Clostridia bacterium]